MRMPALRKNNHHESTIQEGCVKWFRLQYPEHVIFAIPNGGLRSKATAKVLKKEGVLAGVADLMILHGTERHHGLFIEMKSATGTHEDSQKAFEGHCRIHQYAYHTCRSLDQFMHVVNAYIGVKKNFLLYPKSENIKSI